MPGFDFDKYLEAMSRAPVKALHVNTRYMPVSRFAESAGFSAVPIKYCKNGLYIGCESPGRHPYHDAGVFYVQDPSAMAAAHAVDIQKNWKILDMCAAPGGKTSQFALAASDGVVVANEAVAGRCRILADNVERMGYANVIVTCADAGLISQTCGGAFDLALVDAPCSGEGLFRKNAGAAGEWSPEAVAGCAARQRRLLGLTAGSVREGGYLIYSTCTFSIDENELNVINFLKNNPEYILAPCSDEIVGVTAPGVDISNGTNADLSLCRRFYPYGNYPGEGQFIATFQKIGAAALYKNPSVNGRQGATRAEINATRGFLRENLSFAKMPDITKIGGRLFLRDFGYAPALPTVICGVGAGEAQGARFKPYHHLFSAYGNDFYRKIIFGPDDRKLQNYRRGETLEPVACGDGWAAAVLDGAPLGGAKVKSGLAKNHYPKRLRRHTAVK